MEYVELVGIGLISGIISSFFGIGGGLVIVPLLLLIYPEMPYEHILGCSFGVIFLNSILNTYNFSKYKLLPPFKFVRVFLVGVFPGIFLGTYLVTIFSADLSRKIFAVFLIFVVLNNYVRSRLELTSHQENLEGKNFVKFATGFFAGVIAGLTGIGGGTVLVPVFMTVFHIPPKKVSPASNYVMIFLTGLAFIRMLFTRGTEAIVFSSFQFGATNFLIVSVVFIGTLFSSRLGARLNDLTEDRLKSRIFTVMLLALSVKLFID